MSFSLVRFIKNFFAWASLVVGTALNIILIYLIRKHTPKTLKVYSKILLQTCFTDMALLLSTALTDQAFLVVSDGVAVWLSGPLNFNMPQWQVVNLVLYMIWVYLVYFSLFGFVSQFVYRWMTLVKGWHLSTSQYFVLLAVFGVIPVPYVVAFGICYYPPPDHVYLRDTEAAGVLGLNITAEPEVLAGWNGGGGWLNNASLFYMLFWSTSAYIVIAFLSWRLIVFVKKNLKGASNNERQTLEIQRQITNTLIVQAILPICIYLVVLFVLTCMVFQINFSGVLVQMQYYYILSSIPLFTPATLNSAVAMYVIKEYRIVIRRALGLPDPVNSSATLFQKTGIAASGGGAGRIAPIGIGGAISTVARSDPGARLR